MSAKHDWSNRPTKAHNGRDGAEASQHPRQEEEGPTWQARRQNGGAEGMSGLVQWPRAKYWDRAWNPMIGCKPVSPACEHCYARAWAKRFGQSFKPHYAFRRSCPKRGVVFAGNMTDLWGEWASEPARILAAGAKAGKEANAYLWLTKRPGRMCDTLSSIVFGTAYTKPGLFRNHFFGYTGENQEWFDKRQRESMGLPTWANMWYSLEPLLGPIELGAALVRSSLKWVVVGAESGPNRRPCGIGWVASIVAQCLSAGVPVFVKQICLPDGRFTNRIEEFPAELQIRQVPWAKKGEE